MNRNFRHAKLNPSKRGKAPINGPAVNSGNNSMAAGHKVDDSFLIFFLFLRFLSDESISISGDIGFYENAECKIVVEKSDKLAENVFAKNKN